MTAKDEHELLSQLAHQAIRDRHLAVKVGPSHLEGDDWRVAFETRAFEPWLVRGFARTRDEQLVIDELYVSLDPDFNGDYPKGGLTQARLRDLRLGELLAAIRAELVMRPVTTGLIAQLGVRPASLDEEIRVAEDAAQQPHRRGRPRLSDAHYRWAAKEVILLTLSQPGLSAAELREALAKRHPSNPAPATVRDWIREARRRGYLIAGAPRSAAKYSIGPRLIEETRMKGETSEQAT